VNGPKFAREEELFLMWTSWISLGHSQIVKTNGIFVELDLAHAQSFGRNNTVYANLKQEPFVLEAANQRRLQEEDYFLEKILLQVQDSHSAIGMRFEYVVAQKLSALFRADRWQNLVSELRGENGLSKTWLKINWKFPPTKFGMFAVSLKGYKHFFEWMQTVLDPADNTSLRVCFPDAHAGPDIVVVLTDVRSKRVLPVLVQVKYCVKLSGKQQENVERTVDPGLLYCTMKRGTKKQRRINGATFYHDALMKRLEGVAVLRLVVSGKALQAGEPHVQSIVCKRNGKEITDLSVVLDSSRRLEMFGEKIANVLDTLDDAT
jgi:hypothetical protein